MPRPRVLVVDDDPRLVHVVSMYLGIEGFEVDTAADGEEALGRIEAALPDVVVLDVMMAGMDGLEACRRIKRNPATAHVPVILFTALSRDEDARDGRAAGADQFISKPFSLVGLGGAIRSLVGGAGVSAAV
ncbi:MAG TPA: response regulator [Candidatus Dormibacteraeota bacterium]